MVSHNKSSLCNTINKLWVSIDLYPILRRWYPNDNILFSFVGDLCELRFLVFLSHDCNASSKFLYQVKVNNNVRIMNNLISFSPNKIKCNSHTNKNSSLSKYEYNKFQFFLRIKSIQFFIGSFIKGETQKFHLEMNQMWPIKEHLRKRWPAVSGSQPQNLQVTSLIGKRELSFAAVGRILLMIFQSKSLCLLWILAYRDSSKENDGAHFGENVLTC